ncbi:MAG: [acyl-carrier-protein] S-malonyltransferase [Gammaproteobacteria bacterium]|nr:[acyl-carrier-protein] S-malonyltransferase [Gammaproteobacteria bacterium]HBW84871.1 [acyl-carrier-protein] S-malonyltransferase [Gammaproteobacteria bacterium]
MKKIGFVFPGQGSQKKGMLADLASENRSVLDTFDHASEVLGEDLWRICQLDPGGLLNRTEITQPALLAASVAIGNLWRERGGLQPMVMAGHSLGEYSALVLAGVLSFEDAVSIVHKRGAFMQSAVEQGQGKMAAIVGLEDSKLVEICARAASIGTVSAANFNSPGQTVIAGEAVAVDRAMKWCKEAGAKRALPLNVSVPSHCPLMRPAAVALEEALAGVEFKYPEIPVVQNVSGAIQNEPKLIKENLIKQLYNPVLWVDCVKTVRAMGVQNLIEVGPGKVLSGLVKRIAPELGCAGSEDPMSFESVLTETSC